MGLEGAQKGPGPTAEQRYTTTHRNFIILSLPMTMANTLYVSLKGQVFHADRYCYINDVENA